MSKPHVTIPYSSGDFFGLAGLRVVADFPQVTIPYSSGDFFGLWLTMLRRLDPLGNDPLLIG